MIRTQQKAKELRNATRFSNLALPQQKIIVISDKIGTEPRANRLIVKWLSEQYGEQQGYPIAVNRLNECAPFLTMHVSKLERHFELKQLFQFIASCRKNVKVMHLFVWVAESKLKQPFVLPYLEHMSDTMVTLEDGQHLALLVKKASGAVTNKYYEVCATSTEFNVIETKRVAKEKHVQATAEPEPPINPATLGTFKIDLKETEQQAKNALTLPFEFFKTTPDGGKILYHPDAADDLDEEDPDDDLLI
ncbi:elongator complex protein 5 [Anopheles aquasalis]|uniref:elongator complex protein 5 n=1 Tax=Anopheles aquasalis TaxID=42839 RepID=UPI00215ADAA3|nr:elongator complex protein 5 [Anopheles aquasalis]